MRKGVLLLLPVVTTGLFADTVFLKNGTEITGEIVSDTPESVVIEYKLTESIKDQKTIARDRIASVSTSSDEDKEFAALGPLASPETALNSQALDQLIEKKIGTFVRNHPDSKRLPEIEEALKSLEADRARLRSGDRKVEGDWISAAQIASDPSQWDARFRLVTIREAARNNDPVTALRTYEVLEKKEPGSRAMPDALKLALTELDKLEARVFKALADLEVIEKRRQKALSISTSDQAREVREGLEKENAIAREMARGVELDGTKFVPVFPNTKESLDALELVIKNERARLTQLRKIPMRESLDRTRDAERLLASGNPEGAKAQIAEAEKLWPANADLATLKRRAEELSKPPAPTNTSATAP